VLRWVLTEYIEPIDRTLIAHWALDEAEGMVAQDSAGNNDAVTFGGSRWQPGVYRLRQEYATRNLLLWPYRRCADLQSGSETLESPGPGTVGHLR